MFRVPKQFVFISLALIGLAIAPDLSAAQSGATSGTSQQNQQQIGITLGLLLVLGLGGGLLLYQRTRSVVLRSPNLPRSVTPLLEAAELPPMEARLQERQVEAIAQPELFVESTEAVLVEKMAASAADVLESIAEERDTDLRESSKPTAAELVPTSLPSGANPVPFRAAEADLAETTRLPRLNIVQDLIRDLQHPDPTVRRKAIWELGQKGDAQALQPLVDALIDADSQQRSLIMAAVAEISNRTFRPLNRALLISLQDENAEVRKNAIRDLTRVYDQMAQVSQLLIHAVHDPDPEVQETAQWALNQINRLRPVSPEPQAPPSNPDPT